MQIFRLRSLRASWVMVALSIAVLVYAIVWGFVSGAEPALRVASLVAPLLGLAVSAYSVAWHRRQARDSGD